jgi:hypothetical protein
LRRSGLSSNVFNGALPDFLGTLPQLTALQLATNYFTGVCARARACPSRRCRRHERMLHTRARLFFLA